MTSICNTNAIKLTGSHKSQRSHADPDLSREGGPQGPEAFSESAAGGEDIIHQKYMTRHAAST